MEIPNGFVSVGGHDKFWGKMLFKDAGEIINVQLAVIEPNGGGPVSDTAVHDYDHLFVMLDGECVVKSGTDEFVLKENEAVRVDGTLPHSTWNKSSRPIKMLGICVKKANNAKKKVFI